MAAPCRAATPLLEELPVSEQLRLLAQELPDQPPERLEQLRAQWAHFSPAFIHEFLLQTRLAGERLREQATVKREYLEAKRAVLEGTATPEQARLARHPRCPKVTLKAVARRHRT